MGYSVVQTHLQKTTGMKEGYNEYYIDTIRISTLTVEAKYYRFLENGFIAFFDQNDTIIMEFNSMHVISICKNRQ